MKVFANVLDATTSRVFNERTNGENYQQRPRIQQRQRAQKIHCFRKVDKCIQFKNKNASCFAADLGYSRAFLPHQLTEWAVQDLLANASALRHAPKCWERIQPLLCAYYLPECHSENNTMEVADGFSTFTHMIPKKLCLKARESCNIIRTTDIIEKPAPHQSEQWPTFLDCDNQNVFYEDHIFWPLEKHISIPIPQGANITCHAISEENTEKLGKVWIQDSIFQGMCLAPYMLPNTQTNQSSFDDIEGCDLSCQFPQFTLDERQSVRTGFSTAVYVGLFCNFVALLTILIGGIRRVNCRNRDITNYPNQVVFFMQIICLLWNFVNWTMWNIAGMDKLACQVDGRYFIYYKLLMCSHKLQNGFAYMHSDCASIHQTYSCEHVSVLFVCFCVAFHVSRVFPRRTTL